MSTESFVEEMRAGGHPVSEWSNGPGCTYATHSHSYKKLLCCLEGSIVFHVGTSLADTMRTRGTLAGGALFVFRRLCKAWRAEHCADAASTDHSKRPLQSAATTRQSPPHPLCE